MADSWHGRAGGRGHRLTGCQTYPAGFGGMTLPSPHYLKHYPQYFPPDPPFPLPRELDSMQNAEGLVPGVGPGGVGPAGRGAPIPAPLPAPGVVPLPGPVPAGPGLGAPRPPRPAAPAIADRRRAEAGLHRRGGPRIRPLHVSDGTGGPGHG